MATTKPTREQWYTAAKAEVRDKKYTRPNKYINYYYGGSTNQKPSWCGMFVYYVLVKKLNAKYLLKGCTNVAYVPTIYNWATSTKKITKKPQKGDLVLFDWEINGRLNLDHVGFFIKDNGNGTITTLEGNTSSLSDGDGDHVQIRTRSKSYVACYIALDYKEVVTVEAKKPEKVVTYPKYRTLEILNIREAGNLNAKSLGKIPANVTFTAKSELSPTGWVKLTYEGITGYVRVKSTKKTYCEHLK